MAIQINGSGSGAGRGRSRGLPAMAEINIIPLVDVVLVLLIIFMLTAHVMEFGLEVDVPRVDDQRASAEELPVITISKTGEIFLNDKPANINQLGQDVQARFKGARAVYVRADKETVWDPIAQVVNALGKAKLEVRMVTQPLDRTPGRR
ncbi:MAG: biopolymer transporter ExbD [Bryobacterales bacterium]|nr:biopolymer transporter ExbD [Bryobacterales bacterium]